MCSVSVYRYRLNMFLALGDDWQVHYFVFDVILKYNQEIIFTENSAVCLSLCVYFGKRYYLNILYGNVARLVVLERAARS